MPNSQKMTNAAKAEDWLGGSLDVRPSATHNVGGSRSNVPKLVQVENKRPMIGANGQVANLVPHIDKGERNTIGSGANMYTLSRICSRNTTRERESRTSLHMRYFRLHLRNLIQGLDAVLVPHL